MRWRDGEKTGIPLIHLASLCCRAGPMVTSEIEDEHERELQRGWPPLVHKKKKSAPNYFESKYQLKQVPPLPLPQSEFMTCESNARKADGNQQSFESRPDGSNMTFMLIHQFFFFFDHSRWRLFGMCSCGSKLKHSEMLRGKRLNVWRGSRRALRNLQRVWNSRTVNMTRITNIKMLVVISRLSPFVFSLQ